MIGKIVQNRHWKYKLVWIWWYCHITAEKLDSFGFEDPDLESSKGVLLRMKCEMSVLAEHLNVFDEGRRFLCWTACMDSLVIYNL